MRGNLKRDTPRQQTRPRSVLTTCVKNILRKGIFFCHTKRCVFDAPDFWVLTLFRNKSSGESFCWDILLLWCGFGSLLLTLSTNCSNLYRIYFIGVINLNLLQHKGNNSDNASYTTKISTQKLKNQ